jgi:hypothetical protein
VPQGIQLVKWSIRVGKDIFAFNALEKTSWDMFLPACRRMGNSSMQVMYAVRMHHFFYNSSVLRD